MTRFILGLLFGASIAVLLLWPGAPVATAKPALPAPSLRVYALPQERPAEPTPGPIRPDPAKNPDTAVGRLGLDGSVQCFNCAPFEQMVKVSHYEPLSGPINCWDYDPKNSYCYSPTWSGIHWKSVYGFGAACPVEWKLGTWVVVPGAGAFICVDHGNEIICDPDTSVCNVDILGPSGPWDGKVLMVTLWVPLDPERSK